MSLPFTCFTGKPTQVRIPTLWPALLLVVYHYPAFKSNCLELPGVFKSGASHLPESYRERIKCTIRRCWPAFVAFSVHF